jgi:pimeloyl-ACP methyl ester carboxylesterase
MALSVRSFGEGRPVILLPWFGLDSSVTAAAFEPAFPETSGWHRYYLDLPGTGNSSPVAPTSDAVLDTVADTIRDLIGDTQHALAGCSYGGYLAAALAGRPHARIAGLLLVCAGVKILPSERNLSGLVASPPQPGWLDATPQEWHQHFQHAIGVQTPDVARRVFEAVKGSTRVDDYLDDLRRPATACPTRARPVRTPDPPLCLPARKTASPATWTWSARSPATPTATSTR